MFYANRYAETVHGVRPEDNPYLNLECDQRGTTEPRQALFIWNVQDQVLLDDDTLEFMLYC